MLDNFKDTDFTKLIVRRKNTRTFVKHYGYQGYYENRSFQYLVKRKQLKILGFTFVKEKIVDSEEIPQDVLIALGTVGYSDWKSKFSNSGAKFEKIII